MIVAFVERYPEVELVFREGDPEEVCQMVEDGVADYVSSYLSQPDPHR